MSGELLGFSEEVFWSAVRSFWKNLTFFGVSVILFKERGDVMTHEMKLNREPFLMIESGKKRYELRLYDEKRQKLSVGDTILFTMVSDLSRKLTAEVIALHCFPSFDALYGVLPLRECGYREEELSTASPDDMAVYYSPEEQKRYGVVAIELKLI